MDQTLKKCYHDPMDILYKGFFNLQKSISFRFFYERFVYFGFDFQISQNNWIDAINCLYRNIIKIASALIILNKQIWNKHFLSNLQNLPSNKFVPSNHQNFNKLLIKNKDIDKLTQLKIQLEQKEANLFLRIKQNTKSHHISMFPTSNQQLSSRSAQSQMHSKRQNFRKQIRRQYISEYQRKIRQRLFFKSEQNYILLHGINLTQEMAVILNYEFPTLNQNNQIQFQQVQISEKNTQRVYDLEDDRNQRLTNAISNVFLYTTSTMEDHATKLIEEKHILRLTELLKLKVENMRATFQSNNFRINQKGETLILPSIYEKLLIILTRWSFSSNIYFQDSYKIIIRTLTDVLMTFPNQTRVVDFCVHSLGNSLNQTQSLQFILRSLQQNLSDACTLAAILEIFDHEVNNFDIKSYHSNTIVKTILYFQGKLFHQIQIIHIFPQMKHRLLGLFQKLINLQETDDSLLVEIVRALTQLYQKNLGKNQDIIFQTQFIIDGLGRGLNKLLINHKKQKINLMTDETQELCSMLFQIFRIIFDQAGETESGSMPSNFEQVAQFLGEIFDNYLDEALIIGLKSSQKKINQWALELLRPLCLWGDFIQKVHESTQIIARLFRIAQTQVYPLNKLAIECLCNFLEGYFADKNYSSDQQNIEIYQELVQNFDFLVIIYQNLDKYNDFELNRQILNIIYVLCSFWISDPELNRLNRFWMKFMQCGGELKLNHIICEQRNEELQKRAMQILNSFAIKQQEDIII